MKLQYFDISEFDCPSLPNSGINMDKNFLKLLDKLRHRCGFPLYITSGYRSKEYNELMGGSHLSAHTKGLAVDIRCSTSYERLIIVIEAFKLGINRIGVYNKHVHLDIDETLPPLVMWLGVSK